jgi:hypothetical protein
VADSVQFFAATITAGTAAASPMTVTLSVLPGVINAIHWRVPPGPRGLLGWQLAMGGVNVIPEQSGVYIIADNDEDTITVSGLPDSGAWQVIGYNTGTYNHTIYLSFHVTPQAAVGQDPGVSSTGFPLSDSDVAGLWLT